MAPSASAVIREDELRAPRFRRFPSRVITRLVANDSSRGFSRGAGRSVACRQHRSLGPAGVCVPFAEALAYSPDGDSPWSTPFFSSTEIYRRLFWRTLTCAVRPRGLMRVSAGVPGSRGPAALRSTVLVGGLQTIGTDPL